MSFWKRTGDRSSLIAAIREREEMAGSQKEGRKKKMKGTILHIPALLHGKDTAERMEVTTKRMGEISERRAAACFAGPRKHDED